MLWHPPAPTFLCLRTFTKDLSSDLSKNQTTLHSPVRYAIFQTCHYMEVWKLGPSITLTRRPPRHSSIYCTAFCIAIGHIGPIGHIGRRLTPLAQPSRPLPVGALLNLFNLLCAFAPYLGTSQTCLRVQGVFPPARARGSAPPLFNLPIPLCPLWLLVPFVGKQSGSPACASTPSICNKSAKSAVPILAVLCGSSCSL